MFGVEGSGNEDDMGDKVAFTLFGALTKRSENGGGDEIVLEKAQVVMKRK